MASPVSPEEQRRLDKRWEKLKSSPSAGNAGALGQVLSAFSPSIGHAVDEQQRLANTRHQQDTAGGRDGVDLDRGIVRIRRTRKPEDASPSDGHVS